MLGSVLDANGFRPLLNSGANKLVSEMERINALNVFPVPDGDTGTNMCLTIQGGIESINVVDENHIGNMFKKLAKAMTMSARGNSGVILSQFFKGMADALKDCAVIDKEALIAALLGGSTRAYKVVQNPTEGTMLTVMRVAAEKVKEKENEFDSLDSVLNYYVQEAEIALLNTPELLPVLKEAGVIDSGGAGFLCIFEGILSAIDNSHITNEMIEETLCHCSDVLMNTQIVNNTTEGHQKYAVVAVSCGDGISELFKDMGADVIVFGGQTMNPSSADFIKAFQEIDADNIFVFPNNKNIFLAAQQAAKNYDKANIVIIPSKTISSCYAALSMLDYTSDNLDEIVNNFVEAVNHVISASVTYAIRDTKSNDLVIHKNDYMAIIEDEIKATNTSKVAIVRDLLNAVDDLHNREVVVFIYGADVLESEKEEIRKIMTEEYSFLEFGEIDGQQSIYSYFITIE